MTLTDFYIVTTQWPTQGFGSAGDVTTSRDTAYDQFADMLMNGQSDTRVFHIEFAANVPVHTEELTADMLAEFNAICEARGLAAQ